MKMIFISNYMVIHQKPFCDEMIALLGEDNFSFIACEPLDPKRSMSGYVDMNQDPCVIRAYESAEAKQESIRLALEADVAIVTIGYPEWLELRRRRTDGLTFIYIERLLKLGLWYRYCIYPKYVQAWRNILRYRKDERYHVLCASAFGSYDLQLFIPRFPEERCWKWGYFPSLPPGDESVSIKQFDETLIVWVARLIGCKRPDMPIKLAKVLKSKGYKFKIIMIGGGPLEKRLKRYSINLGVADCVEIRGTLPNNEVREYMRSASMLLLTSNRREGWGAVINECMAEGCIPVASGAIGSAPYLIKDGINGRVFKTGDIESLSSVVEDLLNMQAEQLASMRAAALSTVSKIWNARNAAQCLLRVCGDLLDGGNGDVISTGPGSKATVIDDRWYC